MGEKAGKHMNFSAGHRAKIPAQLANYVHLTPSALATDEQDANLRDRLVDKVVVSGRLDFASDRFF